MDDDLVRKAKEALLARVSCPAPNIYNIVIPVSEQGAERLINAFCDALDKRDDFRTYGVNIENKG